MSLTKVTYSMIVGGTVCPVDFGAVGDGTTDDKTALLAAFATGKVVDGGGLTYAINGTCTPTAFVGLRNANFVQIANTAISNSNTLNVVGFSNFFIDNVSINMGSNVTTLFSDDGNNALYVAGNAYNNPIFNFSIRNVTVTGNGCGTGIHVRHAERFTISGCLVRDRIAGSSPDPTNDSQNGIQIKNCSNFTLSDTNVYNLKTRLASVDSFKWTRGFLFAEIRDSTITGCNSTGVDQGFDFSGAYEAAFSFIGNRRWTIGNCTANACLTYGFKFANVTRDGLVTGCIANNIGTIGFIFSPSSVALTAGLEKYNTQNIDVIGCKVVNVLGTGWSGSNAEGFRISSNATYADYPRSIRLKSCSVIDTQDTPTTLFGYRSDSLIPLYPTTGYNTSVANTTQNCTVDSNVATPFYEYIGPNVCVVTGTTTQSLTTATWTPLAWDQNVTDPTRLHNTASSNASITIKTTGWYALQVQAQFATNATGIRGLRILKNGVAIDRTTSICTPNSTNVCSVVTAIWYFLESADVVGVQAYQDSGGALNLLVNESNFSVSMTS